jgi:hypothetical protein
VATRPAWTSSATARTVIGRCVQRSRKASANYTTTCVPGPIIATGANHMASSLRPRAPPWMDGKLNFRLSVRQRQSAFGRTAQKISLPNNGTDELMKIQRKRFHIMINNLEDAVAVLYRSLDLREVYRSELDPDDPEASPTEESVLRALREAGDPHFIAHRDKYTKAARQMLKGTIDQQR